MENDLYGNDHVQLDANPGIDYMSWLWSNCVKPILKELKNSQAPDLYELPRVLVDWHRHC